MDRRIFWISRFMPSSNPPQIRYAILKAVSSEAQAASDKYSLGIQEQRSREAARAHGWIETAGPYEIPGESRTKYVNLAHAEAAMPDLKRLLDDAHERAYDVLVMYDYDRLRDLLGMVSKTLSHYRVQMYAVNLPVEPVSPAEYTPYKNDMAIMMETFAMMKQRTQTNDLRRKYIEAMPKRASKRGLPVHVPFGYKKPINSTTPPEIDETAAIHVLEIKDMFLAGKSTNDCADYLASSGVAPKGKKWYPQTVKAILTNPFYAGLVRWGMSRSELDPRTGRVKRNRKIDPETVAVGPGKHQPLWDEATYEALVAEFKRRGKTYSGKSSQALSSLLTCETCGLNLWAFYNSHSSDPKNLVWRCSSREEHVTIRNTEALRRLADVIERDIVKFEAEPDEQEGDLERKDRRELIELKEQRERLVNAYSIGLLNMADLSESKPRLDESIQAKEITVRAYDRARQSGRDRRIVIATLKANLHALPTFLNGSPPEVNFALRKIFSGIQVTASGELIPTWL